MPKFENKQKITAITFKPKSACHNLCPLGQLYCDEKAKEQAKSYGHSIEREVCFLVAHSMLHLLGYDHMTPEDEKKMFTKQESVLQYLSILR